MLLILKLGCFHFFLLMSPGRASDVTTKSEFINNIDISISSMFVVCSMLNKTRKGSWSLTLWKLCSINHLLWASLEVKDPGFLCSNHAQIWHSSYQIRSSWMYTLDNSVPVHTRAQLWFRVCLCRCRCACFSQVPLRGGWLTALSLVVMVMMMDVFWVTTETAV